MVDTPVTNVVVYTLPSIICKVWLSLCRLINFGGAITDLADGIVKLVHKENGFILEFFSLMFIIHTG